MVEFFNHLKNKTLEQLKVIAGEEGNDNATRLAEDYFYRLLKPKVYWGADGVEAKQDKDFEASCVILSQKVSVNPKTMTVMEFYSTLEELKRQAEYEKSISKK